MIQQEQKKRLLKNMIVYYNVCDQCSRQTQIEKGDTQFEFAFQVNPLYELVEGKRKYFSDRSVQNKTFCDKECLIEYLKVCIDRNGSVREEKNDEQAK